MAHKKIIGTHIINKYLIIIIEIESSIYFYENLNTYKNNIILIFKFITCYYK